MPHRNSFRTSHNEANGGDSHYKTSDHRPSLIRGKKSLLLLFYFTPCSFRFLLLRLKDSHGISHKATQGPFFLHARRENRKSLFAVQDSGMLRELGRRKLGKKAKKKQKETVSLRTPFLLSLRTFCFRKLTR